MISFLVMEESAIVVIIFIVNIRFGMCPSNMQRYILSWKFHNNSILLFARNSETMSTYKRVLLKLSGESLGGPAGKGIDENWLAAYAEEIAEAAGVGVDTLYKWERGKSYPTAPQMVKIIKLFAEKGYIIDVNDINFFVS